MHSHLVLARNGGAVRTLPNTIYDFQHVKRKIVINLHVQNGNFVQKQLRPTTLKKEWLPIAVKFSDSP